MNPATFLKLIQNVDKPSQYLGNETNAIHKDFAAQDVRVALVFPDLYEMGMSHMGQKILYEILNAMDGVVAERVFAPALDFERKLRAENIPYFSLESKTPLKDFDIIGISVPYELTYTNLLNILDLAQMPLRQADRDASYPLVVAGGTGSFNPEPYADFVDAVAIGDGEDLIVDLVAAVREWKTKKSADKTARLEALTQISGIYVPSFFDVHYSGDGTIRDIVPLKPGYTHIPKRVVQDLDKATYPTKLVVPNTKLIHDRIGIEIQRGCTRMCRFCQAGYIERPTRQRAPETVLNIAETSLRQTGMDEISLLSLSAGDYQTIVPTLKELNRRYADQKISISVPATRTETLTPEMIEQVKKVRKTGFTIAPEAGTPRMRRVINKGNKREDLLQACENAFSAGYELIKFYYMCGLPFERDEDLQGIADETFEALQVGLKYSKRVKINVSVSSLVPKPFTPFQWVAQESIATIDAKHDRIRSALRDKRLQFKHHNARMSYLEGVFARGDRRLSRVLEIALREGCRFDEWQEHFDFVRWQNVFQKAGVDPDFYVRRERAQTEILPWDHLFSQMRKEWLWDEFLAAKNEAFVADCSVEKCAEFCGVCDFKVIKNRIYVIDEKPLAAKKGNREWYGRFGDEATSKFPSPLEGEAPSFQSDSPLSLKGRGEKQKYRYRGTFSKTGLAVMHGHLELMTLFKRAILRVGADVAYSEGFHPQMKFALGFALPLGVESLCEHFDLVVKTPLDAGDFVTQINQALSRGIVVHSLEEIPLNAPSLSAQTKAMDYEIRLSESFMQYQAGVLHCNLSLMAQGEKIFFTRTRPGKDQKTLCLNDLIVTPRLENQVFSFRNLCPNDGMLKPTEVVMALSGLKNAEALLLNVTKVNVEFLQPHAVN